MQKVGHFWFDIKTSTKELACLFLNHVKVESDCEAFKLLQSNSLLQLNEKKAK